ncbi:MAG: GNAT family N-acetyltransferase [Leptolyngbyaceae cyanobacterium SM1_3_5]|nr:GNAT family N-acetyltransferase [Leptolyngbyaceae cyanobacterium SM1_3_5]
MTASVEIRSATPADVPIIFDQICALADYEKLRHEVTGSAIALDKHLFGDQPCIEALIAEIAGDPVGFALYFPTYSTTVFRSGIYLEDLYVQPSARGQGVGKALLSTLARRLVDRNWSHLNWSVLDWNTPAIQFYERIGAKIVENIRTCRLTGDALRQFGDRYRSGTPRSSPARPVTAADMPAVYELVRGNVEADGSPFIGQMAALEAALFGDQPFVEAIVIEQDDEIAGLALYFTSYSTFLTQPGLHIEDLFVWPQFRGRGLGTALIAAVVTAAIAKRSRNGIDRNFGRVEWGVRTWNHDARRLYERIGAIVMEDWRLCHFGGDALKQLARSLDDS